MKMSGGRLIGSRPRPTAPLWVAVVALILAARGLIDPVGAAAGERGALPTLSSITGFRAFDDGGRLVLEWETAAEIGTAGFHLLRRDGPGGEYRPVVNALLPALITARQGGVYRITDEGARPGVSSTYLLQEVEVSGRRRTWGPFVVTAGPPGNGAAPAPLEGASARTLASYARRPHPPPAVPTAPLRPPHPAEGEGAGERVRISIREDGLYELGAGTIADLLGLPLSQVRNLISSGGLALISRGRPVAWTPAPRHRGVLWYGRALDTVYTDENVYRLKAGDGLSMKSGDGGSPPPATAGQTFGEVLHREENLFSAESLFTDPEDDYWFWDYLVAGFQGLDRMNFTFALPGLAASDGQASLTILLQGGTDDPASGRDHHVLVSLNGTPVGETGWEGTRGCTATFTFDQNLLDPVENTLEVTGLLDDGVEYSIVYLDSFDVAYRRLYQAVDGSLLLRGDGNRTVTVGGFATPDILLLECADPRRPRLVGGGTVAPADDGWSISFAPTSPATPYLAVGREAVASPAGVRADRPSGIRRGANAADYLVITVPGLLAEARRLAELRRSEGLTARVVLQDDIMDEFNDGIYDPGAIRDFLAYAVSFWDGPPRFVVLAGGGTDDYRGYLGPADNPLPPLMAGTPFGLFPSDNRLADLDGDHLPDLAIGRLPATTPEELAGMIAKLTSYRDAPGGRWDQRVMLIADNPDEAGDFTAASEALAALVPPEYRVRKIYLADHPEEARGMVQKGLRAGARMVNYIGHAFVAGLAEEGLLVTSDVDLLDNGPRYPVLTANTCLLGNFALPGSLGKALVAKEGGGAVAVWAPSGLSLMDEARIADQTFYRALAGESAPVLGDLVLRSLGRYASRGSSSFLLDIYTLLGDPAMRVR